MLIFALDSTTAVATVAICQDETPLSLYTRQNGNTHSQTLLPMARSLLDGLFLHADDIDLFACTTGPGSFTGVRIGAATVKGLAFNRGKPCVGVSSLEALAYNLIGFDAIVCSVLHARQFVYCALFRSHNGELTRLCEDSIYRILPAAESELESAVTAILNTLPEQDQNLPVYLVGDRYAMTLSLLPSLSHRLRHTPIALREQNAHSVACLAFKKYQAGEFCSDSELTPVYLRPCQAEQDLQAKLAAKEK